MIAATVMAHPRRLAWAEALADQLDCDVTLDRINDRHETGLRCLAAGFDTDATHLVIVQDDAIVCGDFLAGLEQAVEFSEDRIVGLYVGNVRPETKQTTAKLAEALESGRSWLAMPGPWWGVGIIIPTAHLPSLYEHYWRSRDQNYDRRIERWATAAKVECWYTVPSLVDHRAGEENPSLVPNRTGLNRCARVFLGAERSALDVDWSKIPVPPATVTWRDRRSGRTETIEVGTARERMFEGSPRWERLEELVDA